ncbi:hypothetical protein Ddye_000216 [Dipteronia dyeriana]|uniref:Uncharacterized protein n=1 Tax=Dipteronia dyeriana TaxID=168575 RepID=A0AAD9XLN6_9ROSI|nr:hypothetical protein Ddye_000216 [Dipteronia dyeriana]
MHISLVNWELDPKELETDYYKSLDPDYVCGKLLHKGKVVEVEDVINDEEDVGSDEDRDEKLEDPVNINDGDAAFSNHQRTTSVRRSSNSISEPPAKKQLFPPKAELQTPKSKIQTSVPSNIAELYSVMAALLKECEKRMTAFCGAKFKESEERITAFCKAEFVSIREEMEALHKVRDTTVVVTSEQHIHTSNNIRLGEKSQSEEYGDTRVNAKLDESDLPTKIFDAKLDNTDVLVEGSAEALAQDPDANVAKTALNAEMETSVVSDAVTQDPNNDVEPAKSDIPTTNLNVGEEQPQVLAEHVLFTPTEMDEINHYVLLATQQHVPLSKVQVQVQGIVVDDYPSPAVNMLVPNSDQSVIALDKADPNVEYKDQDKIRVRKRSRFLGSPWTDPMPKKRKKKSSEPEELSTQAESNYNEFTSFLSSKDPTKVYVGQIQQYMFCQDFKQIMDKNE